MERIERANPANVVYYMMAVRDHYKDNEDIYKIYNKIVDSGNYRIDTLEDTVLVLELIREFKRKMTKFNLLY